jgi:hypothetical protein
MENAGLVLALPGDAILAAEPEGLDRATRRSREPPSDAEFERGLRERAVSDPRAAEILLRWLQRPRAEERIGGSTSTRCPSASSSGCTPAC